DPQQISYGKILQIYFSVAHNPTELNRQGPDVGTQYRSAIFYADEEQKRIADSYMAQLEKAHVYGRPIVTRLEKLSSFYPAEGFPSGFRGAAPDLSLYRLHRRAEGGNPEAVVRFFLSRHAGHGDGVNESRPLKEALPAAPPNDGRIARPPHCVVDRAARQHTC